MTQNLPAAAPDREVGRLVHAVLLSGLTLSIVLLLAGIVLAWRQGTELPRKVLPFDDLLGQLQGGQAAGFLALGLIVLIATPFLRVLGTFGISIVQRDWVYILVTGTVLAIMITSILLGRG